MGVQKIGGEYLAHQLLSRRGKFVQKYIVIRKGRKEKLPNFLINNDINNATGCEREIFSYQENSWGGQLLPAFSCEGLVE